MNNVNPSILNIAGRSSNELYTVNVPGNLLNFCNYDFTHFMEESSRLCRESMKSGDCPDQEINSLKNAITSCHKYFENNMRGIFDKIVVDSWIEYICRQGEMGTSTLWNTFAKCKNSFQRAIFQRLSEYRSHRAINQWVNLLKMQEYARKKIDFIFGSRLNNVGEAVGRLNLFDLMFSVAANEQGYSLDAIGSVKVFKGGRLPNSPFVFGGAAKEVIRNLFKDVHFADSLPYASRYEGTMSDWEAMDSFAVIKSHLPEANDTVANTIMKSMVKLPETVYLPSGFKAMLDLEIDTMINNGAFLQRCKRCGEYYIRDDYYSSEYCDNVHRDGTTCREIMEKNHIILELTTEQLEYIKNASTVVYRDMSARLSQGLSQRDFSEWLSNFNVIRNKVLNGEADISVFDEFVRYTREYALPHSEPEPEPEPELEPEAEPEPAEEEPLELTEDNRVVKPYQFTKIDRSELVQQGLLKKEREYENNSPVVVAAAAESAAATTAQPVARIIRGAHPTSYHEIPVGHQRHDEAPAPKVFKAENFAAAENAGEAARAAIQSLGAEVAVKEKPRELPREQKAEQPRELLREQTAEQPRELPKEQPRETEKPKEDDGKVHLPEWEDFSQPAVTHRENKPPKIKLPDFGLQEKADRPDTGRVKLFDREEREEPKVYDREVVHEEPKLFDREVQEPKLFDREVREERVEPKLHDREVHEEPKLFDREERVEPKLFDREERVEPKLFDREEREELKLPEFGKHESQVELPEFGKSGKAQPDFVVDDEDTDFVNLEERPEKPAVKETHEMNRAARAVSAYKSVNDMAMTNKTSQQSSISEDSAAASVMDDFAKILSNMERNDGFDEDDLPLDPDGIPLSHKTKHVMDAIMKNTRVSPSLIYGRRQAAEQNVVLDESFIEKKEDNQ